MAEHPMSTICEHSETIEDPRTDYLCEHTLADLLTIALCALICGAETWIDVASFGEEKRAWLQTFLELLHSLA